MTDLAVPIRDALIGATAITSELSAYHGSFPIFTSVPVPDDAEYPMIVVSPDVALGEEDFINRERPVPVRDVRVYGKNVTATERRQVERIAYAVRALFHRKRTAISVPDFDVFEIRCTGPIPGPVDDAQTVARIITLTVQLSAQ